MDKSFTNSQLNESKGEAKADELLRNGMGDMDGPASPDVMHQASFRESFTNCSQVDTDLALARALQEQERAYLLLRWNNEGREHGTSGSGSCDYEEYSNDGEGTQIDYNDSEGEDETSVFPPEQQALEVGICLCSQEEIDGSLFESDEAFARALQEEEDRDITARMMAFAGIHNLEGDEEDQINNLQDAWQDVDPDNMSYEELVALGEAVGSHNRGLTPELIASLPYSKYHQGASSSVCDSCVICRLDYEDGDFYSILPCKHQYHADCIKNWLQIKRICPICSAEVTA